MKLPNKILFLSAILVAAITSSRAQTAFDDASMTQKITPKEFAIPASPVFDLMGVTPSQVVRSSDIKDFKVDWSFRSYRLSPNLAIQAQPVWELLYNRKSLSKYQEASPLMRKLSTLDVSLGTVENENGERRIGYGIKMNLLKQRDPLMIKDLYKDLENMEVSVDASLRYAELKQKYDSSSDEQKFAMVNQLNAAREAMEEEERARGNKDLIKARIQKVTQFLATEYWNSYYLDLAFGQVATYTINTNGSLSSLRLNRNTGFGFWLNGGKGIGRKIFLSGLARMTFYEEGVEFDLIDEITQEATRQSLVVDNNLITLGANLRYGSPAYTFFAEFLYERKKFGKAIDIIQDPSLGGIPGGKFANVTWDITQPVIISIGGDWRVSRNVVLNYGFRGSYSKTWELKYIIPVVNLSCMMR
ncbi:MAG: hypothetical protein RI973_1331 [Bacteroidota bacterium]|jgi:hypothetical protein